MVIASCVKVCKILTVGMHIHIQKHAKLPLQVVQNTHVTKKQCLSAVIHTVNVVSGVQVTTNSAVVKPVDSFKLSEPSDYPGLRPINPSILNCPRKLDSSKRGDKVSRKRRLCTSGSCLLNSSNSCPRMPAVLY